MDRLLIPAALALALASFPAGAQTDTPSRQHFVAGIDLGYVDTSGLSSWTSGGAGKLRYDQDSDGLVVSRAFLDYDTRLADTIDFNTTIELYDDDLGSALDFTEAYLEWRPIPRSANRYRLKVGAFYPKISLENTAPGWSTPYTISSSAINTWIGEEVRTIGAELSWSRRPAWLGGEHRFGVQAAAFWMNDLAGSSLSWKGWSVHDRQTRFGDELPLPPLPTLEPGQMFSRQDPYLEPFLELDNRVGYYVSADWQIGSRLQLSAMMYDNRADPRTFEEGQYAWYTEFTHFGGKASLPGGFGLIGQWMTGETVMGWEFGDTHAVDVEFESSYLLLTKSMDRHRLSLRYDQFEITENDQVPLDENREDGTAWTVAYRFEYSDIVSFAAEWLQIETDRPALLYYGSGPKVTEEQLQLFLMLRFSR